jgi:hypothetical protein
LQECVKHGKHIMTKCVNHSEHNLGAKINKIIGLTKYQPDFYALLYTHFSLNR